MIEVVDVVKHDEHSDRYFEALHAAMMATTRVLNAERGVDVCDPVPILEAVGLLFAKVRKMLAVEPAYELAITAMVCAGTDATTPDVVALLKAAAYLVESTRKPAGSA